MAPGKPNIFYSVSKLKPSGCVRRNGLKHALRNKLSGRTAMSNEQSEIKKASFWVSQLFIIAATVLGVYLAANQGFEQAILFDNIKGEKTNYYLRKSLQHELTDNVSYIREFIAKVENRIDKPELVLETFIWRSIASSSATLETPSDLLREAKLFYRKADEIMKTPYFNNMMKAKALADLAAHTEKTVIPMFEADTNAIRKMLQAKQIEL